LTYDHRIVAAARRGTFLRRIKECIETPRGCCWSPDAVPCPSPGLLERPRSARIQPRWHGCHVARDLFLNAHDLVVIGGGRAATSRRFGGQLAERGCIDEASPSAALPAHRLHPQQGPARIQRVVCPGAARTRGPRRRVEGVTARLAVLMRRKSRWSPVTKGVAPCFARTRLSPTRATAASPAQPRDRHRPQGETRDRAKNISSPRQQVGELPASSGRQPHRHQHRSLSSIECPSTGRHRRGYIGGNGRGLEPARAQGHRWSTRPPPAGMDRNGHEAHQLFTGQASSFGSPAGDRARVEARLRRRVRRRRAAALFARAAGGGGVANTDGLGLDSVGHPDRRQGPNPGGRALRTPPPASTPSAM